MYWIKGEVFRSTKFLVPFKTFHRDRMITNSCFSCNTKILINFVWKLTISLFMEFFLIIFVDTWLFHNLITSIDLLQHIRETIPIGWSEHISKSTFQILTCSARFQFRFDFCMCSNKYHPVTSEKSFLSIKSITFVGMTYKFLDLCRWNRNFFN